MRNNVRDKIKSTDVSNEVEGLEWLVRKRFDANLKQSELAEKIGITPMWYCLIEKGKHTPSINTAKKIGEVLKFDWKNFYD